MASLVPISKEDRANYACSPCWLESQRDVEAVVILETTYGVLDNPQHTALCGNHAEVVTIARDKKEGTN